MFLFHNPMENFMTIVNEELTNADVQASRRVESKICLALDDLTTEKSIELTVALAPWLYAVKIHDQYDDQGHSIVKDLRRAGAKRVWVDYKLHDTPGTVAARARALARNGASIITVHTAGGIPMMKAAIDAVFTDCGPAAEIWGITLLTSLGPTDIERDFGKYGNNLTAEQIVVNRALMAKEAGLKTVVCSAQEVGMLRKCSDLAGMRFTVPGTRSVGVAAGQQKRSGTPYQAIIDGANLLVAGSQVTKDKYPVGAFRAMAAEIGMKI